MATVLAGGLVDSVNPCAFVTLIFLVGYLTATGRRGREVIVVGAAFTAAVFAAYFAMGVGLASAVAALDGLPAAARALSWVLAAVTFALAAVSVWDFAAIVRGRRGEVKLGLPEFLRKRISLAVAKEFRTRTVLAAALVTGVIVSVIELPCTGQVYLPLIRLMVSYSANRGRALSLLALYNAVFVAPLVVIFVAAYAGTTSEQLAGFLNRHLALSKLAAAVFFAAMGALLIFTA